MRIFGFDLGIASIGWAVVDIEQENANPETGRAAVGKIQQSGVRIFSVAENPKDGSSLAAPRREKRSVRRALRRKALRMTEIRALLEQHGLRATNLVLTANDVDVWALRGVDAFCRRLSSRELARVLIHIAKHRGYKSVQKSADESDKETGKVLVAIARNKECMADYKTMAQMIYKTNCNTTQKYRNGDNVYDNSIPREEIERELNLIFEHQQKYGVFTSELFEKFKNIAFRVRPMQAVNHMVGACSLEPNCLRAPKEAPTAELFVALTKINNMKIVIDGVTRTVDEAERSGIIGLLKSTQKVTYKTLHNKIWKGHDVVFRGVKDESKEVFYSMTGWHKLKKILDESDMADIKMLDRIIKVIATQKDDVAIEKEMRRKKVPEKYVAVLKNVSTSGFINLSLRALYKIVPEMMKGLTYDKACEAAGYHFNNKITTGVVTNNGLITEIAELTHVPVVNRTVAQFRKVYNALVRKYGQPDQVNLEVGRELKNNYDDRKKIEKKQEENRLANEAARSDAMDVLGDNVRTKDVLKYKLYRDQNGKCMYSGETIDLAHIDNYEVDHILPYSRSLDNSYANKVLVKYTENQAKGNKTPYEYFGNTSRWDEFVGRVSATKTLGARKIYNLLNKDFVVDEKDFRERNANDNAYAARYVKQVLNNAFPDLRVDVRSGALTHYLRGQWGLAKVRSDSDKHHAQDAIVIACATQGMVQYLSTVSGLFENKRSDKGKPWWESLKRNIQEPWDGFRSDVIKSVDDVFVSRTVRGKATGSAHKETINKPKSDKGSLVLERCGNGLVDKDNMFRMDIFKKDDKYVVVPIFVVDTVDKKRQDIFYPQPVKAKEPVVIDDSYEFVMTLHKDDYIKITTNDDKVYEGYVVQCAMPAGQFIIRSSDNSAKFSVQTDTFEIGEFIVIDGDVCKITNYENGKLFAVCPNGITEEIAADKKKTRGGDKKFQTVSEYEKRSPQKKINIGTYKNIQKFQIGVLGEMSPVNSEKRALVCAIKPQSEKRKGRKQPKRNKNGVANPSNNKTV